MYNAYYYNLAKISAEIDGYPVQPLWIYAQWMHETDSFTSDLCTQYFNLSGVTQQTRNELPQPDGKYFYMKFSSPEHFAQYFGQYLRLYEEDGLRLSFSISAYAKTLKNGGYYGDTYENYLKGMMYHVKA